MRKEPRSVFDFKRHVILPYNLIFLWELMVFYSNLHSLFHVARHYFIRRYFSSVEAKKRNGNLKFSQSDGDTEVTSKHQGGVKMSIIQLQIKEEET